MNLIHAQFLYTQVRTSRKFVFTSHYPLRHTKPLFEYSWISACSIKKNQHVIQWVKSSKIKLTLQRHKRKIKLNIICKNPSIHHLKCRHFRAMWKLFRYYSRTQTHRYKSLTLLRKVSEATALILRRKNWSHAGTKCFAQSYSIWHGYTGNQSQAESHG